MSARPSQRPLVAMLVASGVSLVGTRLSAIALPLFVLITTGSATRTGLVAFAEMAPYVVVQGLAGPLTDRVGPRRVSIVCDLVSAVVVAVHPGPACRGAAAGSARCSSWSRSAGLVRGPGDISKYVMAPAVATATGQPRERVLGLADGDQPRVGDHRPDRRGGAGRGHRRTGGDRRRRRVVRALRADRRRRWCRARSGRAPGPTPRTTA